MKSFIRLGIFLLGFLVSHCVENTSSAPGSEDSHQDSNSILSFILTKRKPRPNKTEQSTDNNLKQRYDTLIGSRTNRKLDHLQENKGAPSRCKTTDCSAEVPILVQARKLNKIQRQNGLFLSKAMGVLDDSDPIKVARQHVFHHKEKNATIPNSKKSPKNASTTVKGPGKQKRKYGRMNERLNAQAKFANDWKRPGTEGHRPSLGNILPLLSDQGKHGPVAKGPAPIEHFQPGAIHLMLQPGKGRPTFKLMKSLHRNPEKKQVGIQGRGPKYLDFLGPHLGAGGLGALPMSKPKTPLDNFFMEPDLAGDIAGENGPNQMQIHVNAPTVIHHRVFPLGADAGSASRPLNHPSLLPLHHFSAPIPAFPHSHHFPARIPAFPVSTHHFHAVGVPFPVPVQSPPRIEHVGYPIPVPVPGPPALHPVMIPVKVPSPPKIQRVPFPVPVRMRPQIHRVPFPVPVVVPAHPQIRHIPYPVPVPVKQPPQVEKFFYPIQLPQPPQIHRVPFPVYIHSPPQVKRVPFPVPSPPEKIPVAIPGPTRYMINKVPFPVIVPRIQNVPFPVPVDVHHHEDDDFDEEMFLPDSSRGTYAIPGISAMNRYFQEHAEGRDSKPVLITGQCLVSPCLNGGTCTAHLDTYRCHCTDGYKGLHCEEQASCQPNPCKNFGSCTEVEKGFECTCKKGYTGKYCGKPDPCYPSPCSNGGTCVQTGNSYSCSCHLGWMGKNCEDESKCLPLNPCQNGGTCSEGSGSYKCDCSPGWKGISCEITAPETVLDNTEQPEACASCHMHAICTRGHCRCRPGYTGDGLSCHLSVYR